MIYSTVAKSGISESLIVLKNLHHEVVVQFEADDFLLQPIVRHLCFVAGELVLTNVLLTERLYVIKQENQVLAVVLRHHDAALYF
jgi:hypothetical protein